MTQSYFHIIIWISYTIIVMWLIYHQINTRVHVGQRIKCVFGKHCFYNQKPTLRCVGCGKKSNRLYIVK